MHLKGDIVKLKRDVNLDTLGSNLQSKSNSKSGRFFLIVSNNINNRFDSPILNILALTSKTKKEYPMHVIIKKDEYAFLDCDNTVLAEQILTVNKDKIAQKVGSLSIADMIRVKGAITTQLLK